jgi:Tfp pilus assembly protein PilW
MRQSNPPRRPHPRRPAGFSLVELMTALVAGMIVSAAVVTFTMASFRSNSEYVVATRLSQELRNSLDLVTRDLRRAGYNENALGSIASGNTSPFSKMLISGECILFAYDRANGTPGAIDVDNGEVRGIRRSSVTFNGNTVGVIEYAESASGTKPTCTGGTATYTTFPPACNSTSHWCALSDPSLLNITALTLTNNGANIGSNIELRQIGVTISGQLANSTTFTRSVSSKVRVRSDCYTPSGYNCATSP